MQIRDAVEADLPAIVEIYNAAIPNRLATADLEPVSLESRLAWFHSHSDRYPVWVITSMQTSEEKIIGWLSFQMFYGRPAYQRTVEVSIYIAPSHQRCGVGKQLLAHAIAQSPKLQISNLVGMIFGHNVPSLRLFSSFGFQQWGLLPQIADLDRIERDLIIMGLRISSPQIR
ncbi:N-acetyltransferase family protein [Tumidithrix elongata RA019]|uniref:N-acetyltransferase family protein n=1 Tax=Tumidithrix elongata BACA0141 TaxID=2716417 RepID=A0AAW9PQ74_9CYAN|nr:N-acetyltransferase family protein [Tumidithrix elongata RA019]